MSRLERVKKSFERVLERLFDDLEKLFPTNELICKGKLLVVDNKIIPVDIIIDSFVKHLLPYESQVNARDERYFLNDPKIFDFFKNESDHKNALTIKDIWTHPDFSEDNKATIWNYLDTFMVVVKKYASLER